MRKIYRKITEPDTIETCVAQQCRHQAMPGNSHVEISITEAGENPLKEGVRYL